MTYRLKQISESFYEIVSNRVRIARVVKKSDGSGWLAINPDSKIDVTAATPSAAFHAMVSKLNRIALCGVDDAAKARTALEQRNRAVELNVAKQNAEFEKSGLGDIFREFGFNPVVRVRTSKIRI